jgi:hypothetical protein
MNRLHPGPRRASLAAAILSLSLLAPTAASASTGDASDGGLWYYSATGMEQLHQRATGAGIKIAVIDGPVNPDAPDLAGTGVVVREPTYCVGADGQPGAAAATGDYARHATQMTSLLIGTGAGANGEPGTKGIAPGAEVEVFALDAAGDLGLCTFPDFKRAFLDAIASGADIINVSGTMDLSHEEMLAALRAGTIVVGAAGNEGGATTGYPATFSGAVAVGTLGPDVQLAEGSPTSGVGVVAPGGDIRGIAGDWQRYGTSTGSSDAAAFTSAALALAWSAYPDATANQMLQSLIRNAGGTEHEPAIIDDAWGYGAVNVRQMLDSDPRGYPDVNPFIDEEAGAIPSLSQVREALGMPDPEATPTPTAEPEPEAGTPSAQDPPDARSDESSSALPVVLGVVALLVVAGVVVAVVVTRRRSSTQDPTDPTSTSGGHHG